MHQIARTVGLQQHMHHPDVEAMALKTNETLVLCLEVLLPAWQEAAQCVSHSLRQRTKSTSDTVLCNPGDILKHLEEARADFEQTAGQRLTDLHNHLLDDHGNVIVDQSGHHPPLLGLMTGLLYVERLSNCSKATCALL